MQHPGDPGRGRWKGCGGLDSCRGGGEVLTGDVAGQGQALAALVLEGGRDGAEPQEEKGLWTQGSKGHG